MKLVFHRDFVKTYRQLKLTEKTRFRERLRLFSADPFDPILNNHPLAGRYGGYRSINIGGDLRAIYKHLPGEICIFVTIGTHHQLYGR
ncbi:MAG: type II toxin-antitoxin system mRNA interferase toxin, RelE/StbE family [Candidatus Liptonbacteria bacterium]|nr:type II toxin-antitoxin system mRNA interferase toxin, RelE/StbE family [Candidatus Liptonbacteria bacterium]